MSSVTQDYKYGSWRLWFHVLLYISYSVTLCNSKSHSTNRGYFWQITDFHYDANYTLHGDPHKMCHYSPSTIHYNLGTYGDYNCDSPWSLVLSSISAMKKLKPQPDFILWTGDSVPHINGLTYDEDKLFNVIRNVTEALQVQFPDTPILPSFGNHDPYPSNQMPIADPHYYGSILDISQWVKLLPSTANETFLKGGYYSYTVSPKLKVICLNTAIYYSFNNITKGSNSYDPSDQFAWFASELEESKLAKQKVYVAAHVPPGSFELGPTFKWFHDDLNNQYLNLIDMYNDVISSQFFGHEHTDSFRVYDATEGYSVMFLSPAVTPWKSTLPGVGYNNPSVRLFVYDRDTADILDYYQYYLNLTQANNGSADWELEYQFTKAYDVNNLKPNQVKKAVNNIVDAHSNKYLHRYLMYNSVSAYQNVSCNRSCVHIHRCVMLNLRYHQLNECLSTHGHHKKHSTTTEHRHHHRTQNIPAYMTGIIIALAVAILLLAIAVFVLCFRNRPYMSRGRGYGRMSSYGSAG